MTTKFVISGATKTGYQIFRQDNGMVVAGISAPPANSESNSCIGAFGEDPNDTQKRIFVNPDFALAWVKDKCREYAGRADVDFFTEHHDKLVKPVAAMPMHGPQLLMKQ